MPLSLTYSIFTADDNVKVNNQFLNIPTTKRSHNMTLKDSDLIDNSSSFLMKYRKLQIGLVIIFIIYALLGFILAPIVLKNALIDRIKNDYQSSLSISTIEINPFELSLKIKDFELKDRDDSVIAQAEEFFINFQISSIYRQAWTFDDVILSSPELFIKRNSSGQLNIKYLYENSSKTVTTDVSSTSSDEIIPLLFLSFIIEDSIVNWEDDMSIVPLKTSFGPINVNIFDLNTLPERSAQQTVNISTASQATIDWTGSLQLNPLKSVAHTSIKGSHFPLISSYLSHQFGFDIPEGNANIELDYAISTTKNDTLSIDVNNFNLSFYDLLINTFEPNSAVNNDHEVIRLPSIKLTGGSMSWPAQTASIDSIEVDDSVISFYRESPDFAQLMQSSTTAESESKKSDSKPWNLKLGKFSLNNMQVNIQDNTLVPEANINVSALNLQIKDINNQFNAKFPTTLSLQLESGGSIQTKGELIVLPEFLYDLELNASDLALAVVQPYINQFIDLEINTGTLNINGQLHNALEDPLLYKGDINVMNLKLAETDASTFLVSLERLWAEKVSFSMANNTLDIHQLHLDKPTGDLVIDSRGGLNVAQLANNNSSAIHSAVENEITEPEKEAEMAIKVGNILLVDASMNFTDRSLPLPFTTKIIKLNGSLSTISSLSEQPSNAAFEGQIDEFGFVRITGTLSPLNPNNKTDILLSFKNIFVPKFSAYTIPFVGREIASGALDLELEYKLNDNQLVGENQIILRNFELGKDVPHPDAKSLPLDLAVALLKDASGKIDIALPVRGDISSPDFSYGSVVGSALSNLLIKIVASPFSLIANLVDFESNELEHFSFIPGRSDLTPPEVEKALKLAEALTLRPNLILELAGVVNIEVDSKALKAEQLRSLLESRIATRGNKTAATESPTTVQIIVLEQLFLEQYSETDNKTKLNLLRESFDEISYINALKMQLILLQTLPKTALIVLANERVNNTRLVIVNFNNELQSQISVGPTVSLSKKSEQLIMMKTKLIIK